MQTDESAVDTVVDPVLEPAQPSRPDPRRAGVRVSGRDQFSLLVVRGDGTRVVRFNFTRPAAKGAFLGLVFSVAVVGMLVGDCVNLRELTREARTLSLQIAQQCETIDWMIRCVVVLRLEKTG